MPLVAGPSAMAMVILSADVLRRYLGRRVIKAVERLMGMILVTLAVEMFLDGLRKYLAQ